MGVKGLAAWLREQYPEAYTFLPRQQRYDHVYVDLPSILHTVARKSACQPRTSLRILQALVFSFPRQSYAPRHTYSCMWGAHLRPWKT